MITKEMSLKEIAQLPLLKEHVPFFVLHMDLSAQDVWEKPLSQAYRNPETIVDGLNRLSGLLEKGNCVYPLYSEAEVAACPEKSVSRMYYFPSDAPEADTRPYVLMVPGGAYLNVWNLTEGWPVAVKFNEMGYHVLVLTYRTSIQKLFPRPLDDMARALEVIRVHEKALRVTWDNYWTLGFSAGANLILNWSLREHGYPVYGLPGPKAMIPVYPPVSWKLREEDGMDDWLTQAAFGLSIHETAASGWNINEHVTGFAPAYIVCCADDDLVDPEHSRLLKKAMDEAGVPAELEIGARGGHGFGEGGDCDVAGWYLRAAAFCAKY